MTTYFVRRVLDQSEKFASKTPEEIDEIFKARPPARNRTGFARWRQPLIQEALDGATTSKSLQESASMSIAERCAALNRSHNTDLIIPSVLKAEFRRRKIKMKKIVQVKLSDTRP